MSKYPIIAVVLPPNVASDASSQEIEAIAHTGASNPAATTESKITTATKATASAPKSNTSDAATANQSTPAPKDKGTAGDQPTSSSSTKRNTAAKLKAATPSVNASSKRGAKHSEISNVEDAVFSPMALVAINDIAENHMNTRIQADRVSIALEMATGDRNDKEIMKTESERATMETLNGTIKLFGGVKAEKLLHFIFNESHKAIQKAQETVQELQLALSESREIILKLESRILELQREKLEKEQAE
ncbi:hypothetical protein RhiJN_07361 [Ceratobasidium sp. AG-Ba]|nr:hypothetical protein RhiJN_07361 [Ceratobasidium sp. AG-Ba]QRW08216.1 hypothetical protein RhiLY_07215 [Ceratobasidium sp. AG-Ba]